ncbi:MAG TPA: AMP-binding protein, partial [Anaerolineae bacterium]|nr:AMP-binding protein [Anaerolineae bacterium]
MPALLAMERETTMITTERTLGQALCEEAAAHPAREALVCGADRLTYAELAARVEALAGGLQRLGLGRGDCVALLLPPGWPFVALFFALARLGAVAVPLNPQLRPRQLGEILAELQPAAMALESDAGQACAGLVEAGAQCWLIRVDAGQAGKPAPQASGAGLPACGASAEQAAGQAAKPAPWKVGFAELLSGEPLAEPGAVAPDDLAAILYTSGTTGRPKGVMHSHRGLVAPVVASTRLRRMWLHVPTPAQLGRMAGVVARYGLRLLQAAGRPQTFLTAVGGYAIAGIEVVLQALLMGDRLILMPRFHPLEMLRCVERERVTVLVAAPLALSLLVRIQEPRRYDLSSLLIVGTGSAPCPPELARQVQRRFGCAIHIGYGMTEVGGGIAATSVEDSAARQAETVGRAMLGMEVRVVDEARQPLPPGQVGELAVRGEGRMLGYYRAPELTEEALDADGWYYTGDLAVIDRQGYIRIVDRKKDIIIRGGQNIYPAEIEQFLVTCHDISEVAVVGVPDDEWGQRIEAAVVLRPDASVGAEALRAHCREHLRSSKT